MRIRVGDESWVKRGKGGTINKIKAKRSQEERGDWDVAEVNKIIFRNFLIIHNKEINDREKDKKGSWPSRMYRDTKALIYRYDDAHFEKSKDMEDINNK